MDEFSNNFSVYFYLCYILPSAKCNTLYGVDKVYLLTYLYSNFNPDVILNPFIYT